MKTSIFSLTTVFLLSACSVFNSVQETRTVTLIHWNDFHSANLPYLIKPVPGDTSSWYSVSGYANFKSWLDSLRQSGTNPVVVFAGDEFQGSPVCAVTRGRSQAELIRHLAPEVMIPGNHEFDYGDSLFFAIADSAHLPLICANMINKKTGSLFFPDYTWVERGGVKLAMIGLMMDDLDRYTMPARISQIRIENRETALKRTMETVRQECGNPDLWVVVSHAGLEPDRELARAVPEIDVILAAHDHEITPEPVRIGKTLIAEAGYRGRYLGELKLQKSGGALDSLKWAFKLHETRTGKLKPDSSVNRIVLNYEELLGAELDQVVGELTVSWPLPDAEENGAANFIADGLREETGADIGVVNAGGIRKPMPPGPVKVRDCWELQPFSNSVVLMSLSGAELLNALEFSFRNAETPLHFSGLNLVMKKNASGKFDLLSVSILGKPVDPAKLYSIATNNYLSQNMKRTFGLDPASVQVNETGLVDREILVSRFRKTGRVSQEPDGRRQIREGN